MLAFLLLRATYDFSMGQETQNNAPDFDMTQVGFYDPLAYEKNEGEVNTEDAGKPGDQTKDDSPNQSETKSPEGDKPNNGQEAELTLGQEDVAKLREVLGSAGFKSVGDLVENWKEQRRLIPEMKSTINTYDARFSDLEARLAKVQEPPKAPPKEYTDEELATMMADKPKEYTQYLISQLTSALVENGPIKDIAKKVDVLGSVTVQSQSDRLLDDLRRDYPDFKNYEDQIDQALQAMGGSLKGIPSRPLVETIYENLKYKASIPTLQSEIDKLKAGDEKIDKDAKKASAIGNANGKTGPETNPEGKPDRSKETLKTPVGEIAREDLDLVYDPTGSYMATLKPAQPR